MEKSCRKCAAETSPRPLFNLVNNPRQPLYVRNYFLKRGLSKGL